MKKHEISQTYIKIKVQPNTLLLNNLKKHFLYQGKIYSKEYLKREFFKGKFYFKVEFVDGSLIGKLKLFGNLSIVAISAYGGLRSGIDYIVNDSKSFSNHVIESLKTNDIVDPQLIERVEKRLGIPGKIKRLFTTIDYFNRERGNITINQQQDLLNKINKSIINLIILLDEPARQVIIDEVNDSGFPFTPNNFERNLHYDRYAIKEENELIDEDDI